LILETGRFTGTGCDAIDSFAGKSDLTIGSHSSEAGWI
jgi:hypothetical protein